MESVTIHMISGWAYPAQCLHGFVRTMAPHATVHAHSFTVDVASMREAAHPWWLCGWSLGGLLAMRAVLDKSLQPSGLILVSATARFCEGENYICGVPRTHLRAMMRSLPNNRANVLQQFYDRSGASAECDFTTDELLRGLQMLSEIDVRSRLDEIPCPTLILHGTRDTIIPADASVFLHQRLKQSKLIQYDQAGHSLPIHHGEHVGEDMIAWIHSMPSV